MMNGLNGRVLPKILRGRLIAKEANLCMAKVQYAPVPRLLLEKLFLLSEVERVDKIRQGSLFCVL